MFRRLFVALALFFAGPALAQIGESLPLLGSPAPFWVLHPNGVYATLDYDFAGGRYYQAGIGAAPDPKNLLTVTRASIGYAPDANGLYYQFANNTPRITNAGLTVEEGRTNDALWSRDLTNAAWVKAGLGTALNAVGIDGTANSATTLTATGAAGVCTATCTALQTITLGSQADTYSVFLKRVTGSGTVNITINNLGGVTPCTLTTTGFTRCSVTATLANPVIGIQLTAVGDVVVADFDQMEPGGFPTTPILTTNATATRAADVSTLVNGLTFIGGYSFYGSGTPEAPVTYATNQYAVSADDGSANNRVILQRAATTGKATTNSVSGGTLSTQTNGTTWNQSSFGKIAESITQGSQAGVFNGGTVGTTAGNLPVALVTVRLGTNNAGALQFNGTLSRIAVWSGAMLSGASLKSLTLGSSP